MKLLFPVGKTFVKIIPSIKNVEKNMITKNIVISHNSLRDNMKESNNEEVQIKNPNIKGENTINNLLYLP